MKSTIFFPALYSELSQNTCPNDAQLMAPIKNDLEKLLNLFGCCKYLRCEALYQLTALSIACWFKSNPNIEDFLEPKHNNNPNLFKILHEKFPYIVDDTVKKNFEL